MKIHNSEIAAKFNELADFLEIEEANPFRVRAYRNAARIIKNLSHEIADLVEEEKDLSELPGIGKDLAEKIEVIVKTGEFSVLNEIKKKYPASFDDMMHIPTLGPKRVKQLYEKLKIRSIYDLKKAIDKGRISQLEGFGEKTAENIKKAIKKFKGKEKRIKLAEADEIIKPLISYLKDIDGVQEVTVAGSYRRRKETIGDIDILVVGSKSVSAIEHFIKYDEVREVVSRGETRSTVKLRLGIQVDLRVVKQESYGAALQYFTGSKEHNIAISKMAGQKNLKINEHGVFKGKKRIASKIEKEIYAQVNLLYIEPELREDHGEIAAAQNKELPHLITLADIRGDLHCHTNYSDGQNSIEEMVNAAKKIGYDYIAITDHSKHVAIAKGLNKKRLMEQIKAIDKLNEKIKNFHILKAIECDILDDGSLDLPNDVLKELDLTVCAIHYKFNLSYAKQTERVLRAMDNPYFHIFAHPTGRLIGRREAYDIDLEKIMEAAKEKGCFLEINAQPARLDLNDIHCRMAKEIGVKLAIGSDAHSTRNFTYMQYGLDQARRGWLESNDVINTYKWPELKKFLRRN